MPMADIKALEHPTLKVPYEVLNKKFRTAQKTIDREVSHVQNTAADIEKSLQKHSPIVGELNVLLDGMVEKLNILKRKAEESVSEELDAASVCKRRLDHLKDHDNTQECTVAQWKKKRMDRMLVEHFLHCGYYNTAIKLAKHSNIEDLTNIDLFMISREVEESLRNHDTSKCLNWCYDNKSKLRKLKSTLEFNLRQQEFIEQVRLDKRIDAVKHARKYFTNLEDDQLKDVQHVMGLLAFSTDTDLSPYKSSAMQGTSRESFKLRFFKLASHLPSTVKGFLSRTPFKFHAHPNGYTNPTLRNAAIEELLDESRWQMLVQQFRRDNFKLYQLSNMSVFSVTLQTGLASLKTPQCYKPEEERNPDCPVCSPTLNVLAQSLPFAHCSQSRLVCHISGQPLNEHNPPLMLPNGYVYGELLLKQMAAENNGKVTCPRTKEVFDLKEAEKVYVM